MLKTFYYMPYFWIRMMHCCVALLYVFILCWAFFKPYKWVTQQPMTWKYAAGKFIKLIT